MEEDSEGQESWSQEMLGAQEWLKKEKRGEMAVAWWSVCVRGC